MIMGIRLSVLLSLIALMGAVSSCVISKDPIVCFLVLTIGFAAGFVIGQDQIIRRFIRGEEHGESPRP
jgi:hypothetical protein